MTNHPNLDIIYEEYYNDNDNEYNSDYSDKFDNDDETAYLILPPTLMSSFSGICYMIYELYYNIFNFCFTKHNKE
jgi:hypothetical protein